MERLVKQELTRFSKILSSYTKIVIGGMLGLLTVSALWSGLSVLSQGVQILVGIVLLVSLLIYLIPRLVPLSTPKNTVDRKEWILRLANSLDFGVPATKQINDEKERILSAFDLTSRDAVEMGSVGALVLLLMEPRTSFHHQPTPVDIAFPLRVEISKHTTEAFDEKITKTFVLSNKDFNLFLADIRQLLDKVVFPLGEEAPDVGPTTDSRPLDSFDMLHVFVRMPDRLMESAGRIRVEQLVRRNMINSDLCRWIITTGIPGWRKVEFTAGHNTRDKAETRTFSSCP